MKTVQRSKEKFGVLFQVGEIIGRFEKKGFSLIGKLYNMSLVFVIKDLMVVFSRSVFYETELDDFWL